jgi:hypothetical protein
LATAYKFVYSCIAIAYFLLHDESNQAVIAALHELDERDHREEDATIKQTRFPQNSERKKTKLSKEELGGQCLPIKKSYILVRNYCWNNINANIYLIGPNLAFVYKPWSAVRVLLTMLQLSWGKLPTHHGVWIPPALSPKLFSSLMLKLNEMRRLFFHKKQTEQQGLCYGNKWHRFSFQ